MSHHTLPRRIVLQRVALLVAVLPDALLASCTTATTSSGTRISTTAAATAALRASASSAVTAMPTRAKQVVSYFVSGDAAFIGVYQSAIKTIFNVRTSGDGWKRDANVQARVIPVPGSNPMSKLETMIAGGTPPDVAGIAFEGWVPLVAKGVALNLDGYINQHPEVNLPDFVAYDIDACTYGGHYYALPRDGGFTEMFYNVGLFRSAGIPTPTEQVKAGMWNWQNFLVSAEKLTKQSNGRIVQFGTSYGDWLTWLFSNQADVLNAEKTAATLDVPNAIDALQFIQDLIIKHKVAPTPADLTAQNLNQLFMTGRLAMTFGFRGVMADYKSITGFRWDVAPIPTGKVRMAHGTSGTNYVDAKSKYPAAAFSLLAFICSTEGQIYRMGKQGTGMPSRTSVLDSPAYLSYKAPMAASTAIDTVWKAELEAGRARTVPGTPQWAEINTALTKQLGYLLDGSRNGKEVGQAMTQAVNEILKT